jgi:hypothetical protein
MVSAAQTDLRARITDFVNNGRPEPPTPPTTTD